VLGAYVLLTLVLTYPVVLHPSSTIPIAHQIPKWAPGDGDPWQSLWGFWFFQHALATSGRIPFTTDLIFYPLGTDIGYVAFVLLTGLISLPLVAVAGIVIAYNAIMVGGLALAGYGTFLLVRRICGCALPAFVGGLVFAFSPYHMAHALEHIFLIASAVWVPLYALFLIRTLDEGGVLNAVAAGLSLVLSAMSNPYYTVFLALFTVLVLTKYLIETRRGRGGGGRVWRRFSGLLLVGAILNAPFAAYAARLLAGSAVIKPTFADVNQWNADLLAFFVPSPSHPVWGAWSSRLYERFTGNLFEQTVYLGYAVLVVGGVALAARWREARFWALSAAVFAVLCLGPLLHVAGTWVFQIDGVPITIPLPGLLLRFLPITNGIRVMSRFDVMVTLCLSVLVGLGLTALSRGGSASPSRSLLRGGLAALCGLAILLEFLSAPLPVLSTETPRVFKAMGREPAPRGSLLDVPLDWRIAKYQYYQTAHQRPLIFGFVPRPPPALIRQVEGVPFLAFFQSPDPRTPEPAPGWDRRTALRVVDLLDLDAIVVHEDYLGAAAAGRAREVVTEYFPVAQVVEEDRMVVFRLRRDHDRLAVWTADAYDFDFAPGVPRFFLARGWWPSEWAGSVGMAWSLGRESTLGFFLPQARAMTMELRLTPLPLPSLPPQRLAVRVNGHPVDELELTRGPGATYTLDVPTSAVRAGTNTIRFTYAYARAPRDIIAGNPDMRELAVAFSRITLRSAGGGAGGPGSGGGTP
jgi:hypothetical protein